MHEKDIKMSLREQTKRSDLPEDVVRILSEAYARICSLESQKGIADEIVASEPFAWLMVGSNHVQSNIEALKPAYRAWKMNGGKSVFHKEYGRERS